MPPFGEGVKLIEFLAAAAVVGCLWYLAFGLFCTRQSWRDMLRDWRRSKIGLTRNIVLFLATLYFFTSLLIPPLWRIEIGSMPTPLIVFAAAVVLCFVPIGD